MSKKISKLILLGVIVSGFWLSAAKAATVTISCGSIGVERKLCEQGTQAWAKQTGNDVKIVSTPSSSTERLSLYQQLLAAQSADVDVFQIDVVWPGMLGDNFIDLSQYSDGAEDDHFSALVKNDTVDGRLVAMPWFTDAGVLYYRKDLLKKYDQPVPETWSQLTKAAKVVQKGERDAGNDKMWGYVWQGRAYEGLTCNALEWLASYNAGTIVDREGKVTVNNPKTVEALKMARGWIDTISPLSVLNYSEEEARGVFQSGNAVFMRNWPYAWSLSQGEDSPVKGKVGVVALPKGGTSGRHAGTLGGWQLAVSKYSDHQKIAADLVIFLTGYDEQKHRAVEGGYNPTIAALYKDKDVLAEVPFMADLFETLTNGVPRPSSVTGEKYGRVSNAFYNTVHNVLSGEAEPDAALGDLEHQLNRLGRRGW